MAEEMSAEEQMRQMRLRFQAVNDASASHSQKRRDANELKDAEDKKSRLDSQAEAKDTGEMDENDSLGG